LTEILGRAPSIDDIQKGNMVLDAIGVAQARARRKAEAEASRRRGRR
jgi:hypothetical protein